MTLLVQTLLAAVILAKADEPEYRYVQDSNARVLFERGEFEFPGKLDETGTFTRDMNSPGIKKGVLISGIPLHRPINSRRPGWERVYEYRSGRLVLGELDKHGNFVQDLDSKLINFKDYRYREDGIKIYNLPGRFVRIQKPTIVAKTEKSGYRYVEDTAEYVSIHRGDYEFIGRLDATGSFTREMKFSALKKGNLASSIPVTRGTINSRGPGWIHVYEYRSSRLIPGELDNDGNFVQDLDGKIIDFKDYRYREDGIKIYNLPGRFVRIEKPKK